MSRQHVALTTNERTCVHTTTCLDNDELLFEIVKYLDTVCDLRSLSLTCRRFHNVIACNDSVWRPLAGVVPDVLEDHIDALGERKWRSLVMFRHAQRESAGVTDGACRVPEIETCHLMAPTSSPSQFTSDGVFLKLPKNPSRWPQLVTKNDAPSNNVSKLLKLPFGTVWQFRCPLIADRSKFETRSSANPDIDQDTDQEHLTQMSVDFCTVCRKQVHYVATEQQLREHAERGDCVFFDDNAAWLRSGQREQRRPVRRYGGCVVT
ncbi:MAG: hypothetical protein MHM6MM_005252 [Cercozoa sp. M6MM]